MMVETQSWWLSGAPRGPGQSPMAADGGETERELDPVPKLKPMGRGGQDAQALGCAPHRSYPTLLSLFLHGVFFF